MPTLSLQSSSIRLQNIQIRRRQKPASGEALSLFFWLRHQKETPIQHKMQSRKQIKKKKAPQHIQQDPPTLVLAFRNEHGGRFYRANSNALLQGSTCGLRLSPWCCRIISMAMCHSIKSDMHVARSILETRVFVSSDKRTTSNVKAQYSRKGGMRISRICERDVKLLVDLTLSRKRNVCSVRTASHRCHFLVSGQAK